MAPSSMFCTTFKTGETGLGTAIGTRLDDDELRDAAEMISSDRMWATPGATLEPDCIDWQRTGGLAGGGLSAALMHHALFGGDSLTANLSQVADLPGVWLSLHEECVALRHWLASMRRLADPQSPLYALRDRLHGYRADGGQRPGRLTTADVDFIVNWAGGFAAQYFPSEMGGKAAADAAGVVCNETPPHRLLDLLVYNRSGLRWAGHDVMFVGFNGRPVVIEAWMADALASALTTHRVLARRLAAIAQLFSLSVATGTLLGPESDICAVAVRSH